MEKNNKNGSFVISLDFEMMWGGIDFWTTNDYGKSHVEQVREVIKRLIELFNKYHVHATFATVGIMMNHDKKEATDNIPYSVPTYFNKERSPYHNQYINHIKDNDQHLFFAPDLIEFLKEQPGIEIGTHTYCHYYCWEEGQTIEQFDADINMAYKVAKDNDIQLNSIVFPRNQVSDEHLKVCAKYGILSYRGNPNKFFENTNNKLKILYNRASRLLDAYLNWGGTTSTPYYNIHLDNQPINIPASRMLRPYMKKLSFLEPLRKRRIKKEILHAAKKHELFHLWWHPHNFGADMEKNFSFLEDILKCYQKCNQKYGMQSMTMNEFYNFINN